MSKRASGAIKSEVSEVPNIFQNCAEPWFAPPIRSAKRVREINTLSISTDLVSKIRLNKIYGYSFDVFLKGTFNSKTIVVLQQYFLRH